MRLFYGWTVDSVVANCTPDGGYGDIYDSVAECKKEHPEDFVLVGYVVKNPDGIVPDGLEDFYETMEAALSAWEKVYGWTVTDDDSFQIRRRVEDRAGTYFELYQIQISPVNPESMYGIAHGFVYPMDMDEESVADTLECYGYESLASFKEEYGEEWPGVLAEMEFELDASSGENLIQNARFAEWEDARKWIETVSGIRGIQDSKELTKERVIDILQAYVDVDFNAMGTGEPIYRCLCEKCGCSDLDLEKLGFSWLLNLVHS